jgi:hypothetical protein
MKSPKRVLSVEGLRGIASLSVAWFHLTNTYQWGIVRASGSWCWLGVEAFFVIFGFVIPYALWMSARAEGVRYDCLPTCNKDPSTPIDRLELSRTGNSAMNLTFAETTARSATVSEPGPSDRRAMPRRYGRRHPTPASFAIATTESAVSHRPFGAQLETILQTQIIKMHCASHRFDQPILE